MAEAAPAPLQVVVGSKNPVKLAAVRKAFLRAFPDRYIAFAGRDVPSGVPDQPWGHVETRSGAIQRARGAFMAETGADYAVGIEGGVFNEQFVAGLRSVAYVAIRRSRDGWESVEHTASFELPPRVARLLRGEEPGHGKIELGAACDLVFKATNSKQQGGTVGALTRGLIDRTTYYEHAVVCALAPFLHDDSGLYDAAAAAPPAPAPVPAPPAPAPAPAPVAPPAAPPDDDSDFELVAVLSPEQRSSESRKRAERDGDVIDLSDLADDDDGAKPQRIAPAKPAWYVAEQHLETRKRIWNEICRLLAEGKSNPSAEWMQKLPRMARRLEGSLFRAAASFEEYRDTSTVKKRLQALAIAMGLRARQQQAAGPAAAPAAPPPPRRPAAQRAGPAAAPRPRSPRSPSRASCSSRGRCAPRSGPTTPASPSPT